MAMAIPIIGLALTAVSGITASNNARNAAAQTEAQDLQAAGQTRASGQRAAAEQLRQSRYVQSRALALAGNSGAGASDPTVVNDIGLIAGEGDYRAATAMFDANSKANALVNEANAAKATGDAESNAALISSASSIASQGSSLYAKYGGPSPSISGGANLTGYTSGASPSATDYGSSIFGKRYGYG